MKKKEVVTIKVDDKDVELWITRPSPADEVEAEKVRSLSWWKYAEATDEDGNRMKSRKELREYLEKTGQLDTAELEKRVQTLQDDLTTLELKLKAGKKGFKTLDDARQAALDMIEKRAQLREIYIGQNTLDANTIESHAENDKLTFLLLKNIRYPDGNYYFEDIKDYLSRAEDPNTYLVVAKYMALNSNYEEGSELKNPENKFLQAYGFIDEKGRFINKDGHLTDKDGRLINENGQFVDAEGNLVDIYGNPVNAEGDYVVEFEDFTDAEGNVIKPKV